MLVKKLFLLIIFISPFSIRSQSFRITKILETNLFELNNNQKVKFYGLFIPSRQDTNQSLAQIASDIYQWEIVYMLNRSFKIDFISKDENGVFDGVIYRSYVFSDENLANRLLSLGYAALLTNTKNSYYSQLIGSQERAQKDRLGIWQDIKTIKSIYAPIINSEKELLSFQKKYEQPYIPLLAISIVSFVLAWDSFSSASDIQKEIDSLNKFVSNKADVSELETSKTRKSIVGVTCFVAGVITALFSFKSVEVKTTLQSISLSYRF